MRRTVATVWAVCLLGGCDPDEAVEPDVSTADGGSELDAAGLDAAGLDAAGLDAPAADVPGVDAAESDGGGVTDAPTVGGDAGEFEGHIVRLANMDMDPRTVELCLYVDGIESPPIRMMEALGRPEGLDRLEVSARYGFTPSRASVPVRVVDVADADCETPIFSTTITGVRNRIVMVLAQLSFTSADDTPMAPTATDQWRHLLHDGASGVLAMTPDGGGPAFRPNYFYAPISASGRITYTPFGGEAILDRGFTPVPGGFLTSFTLARDATDISFVLCDDRAPPVDGLTVCGDTVRP